VVVVGTDVVFEQVTDCRTCDIAVPLGDVKSSPAPGAIVPQDPFRCILTETCGVAAAEPSVPLPEHWIGPGLL
jgi:hypothetical protein